MKSDSATPSLLKEWRIASKLFKASVIIGLLSVVLALACMLLSSILARFSAISEFFLDAAKLSGGLLILAIVIYIADLIIETHVTSNLHIDPQHEPNEIDHLNHIALDPPTPH